MAQIGNRSFRLQVMDKLGQVQKALYTSAESAGILNGFASYRYPSGVCGKMTFNGKPNELNIEVGDVTYLSFDTGERVVPVHMGVVVTAPDPRSGERGEYEVAGGKKLLERSVCGLDAFYTNSAPTDMNNYMGVLVDEFKHPALKYNFGFIPVTGVFAETVDARLTRLDKTLSAILKSVPTITDNDWGVDPLGYVVIRPPTGEVHIPYADVRTQFRGSITADEVVTKATIRVANAVSEGAIVSPGYRPSVIGHTYEAPEHRLWGAASIFELPKDDEGKPVIDVLEWAPRDGFSWNNAQWTLTGGATGATIADVAQDGNLNSYGTSTNVTSLYLITRQNNRSTDRSYVQARGFIGFEVTVDALAGNYDMAAFIDFSERDDANGAKYSVRFDLNYLKNQGKATARFIAPAPQSESIDVAAVQFNVESSTALTGLIKVYEFRALQANATLLEQIARAQIRLPAKELAEVECARGPLGENGFILETVGKTLILDDAPEPVRGTIAEVKDTYNTKDGMRSLIGLGEPIRSSTAKAISRAIKQAVAK